jgi:hypothetical protein
MYQLNHVLCPRVLQEKCAFRYVLKQNYNRIGFDYRLLPVFPILEIKGADSTETCYLLSIIVIMAMLTKSSWVSIA